MPGVAYSRPVDKIHISLQFRPSAIRGPYLLLVSLFFIWGRQKFPARLRLHRFEAMMGAKKFCNLKSNLLNLRLIHKNSCTNCKNSLTRAEGQQISDFYLQYFFPGLFWFLNFLFTFYLMGGLKTQRFKHFFIKLTSR